MREAPQEGRQVHDAPMVAVIRRPVNGPDRSSNSVGAGDGVRTRDIDLGRVALFQLSYSRMFGTTEKGPGPVTVRTNDIALCRLGQDPGQTCPTDESRNPRLLGRGMAVIEVHGTRRIASTTILAWHVAKASKDTGVRLPTCTLAGEVSR